MGSTTRQIARLGNAGERVQQWIERQALTPQTGLNYSAGIISLGAAR